MSFHCKRDGRELGCRWQRARRWIATLGLIAAATGAIPACAAETPESKRVLRIAADPNNLPFSNDRLEGFENKIADLIARELDAEIEYTWRPQRRGFFRETLKEGNCNLVLGVPAGFEMALTTRPYYRSTYVFVFRQRDGMRVQSFDDPILRTIKIGVQMIGDDFMNSPPAHALSARGIIRNIRGYTVYGDYSEESPPSRIVRAVSEGEIDIAIAWGPLAGYFVRRQSVPLEVLPVQPQRDGALPFVYAIAMGVRKGDHAFKQELDALIERKRADIEQILDSYGVPRVAPSISVTTADHGIDR